MDTKFALCNSNKNHESNTNGSTAEMSDLKTKRSTESGIPEVETKSGSKWGLRHLQAILIFLSFFTSFCLRLNLSVAIVAMTDKNSSHVNFEEFDWNQKEKSAVLSSFFWGYLVAQAPAGVLGQKFSPKKLWIISNSFTALLAAITPLSAHYGGWVLLCIIRTCQGLAQGFLMPLTYNLVSRWAPNNERNRFVGFALNGGTLGATIALPICGLLASSSGGWPSIFYLSAALGFIWVGLWVMYGADSPAEHPKISKEEREYIESNISNSTNQKNLKTPWRAMLTSLPVYALLFAHLGNGWAFGLVVTELPSYINHVLKFDIAANGFLSALPYFSMWLLTFPVCWIADYIKTNKILSETTSRKMWTTIAQSGSAILLIILGFVGQDATAAMILLTVTVSLTACIFSGYNINHLDLAPNFAGVLIGITNGLENITTILAPLSVGWIVEDVNSVSQWRIAFLITSLSLFVGNLMFLIFGTAEVQPWNKPKERDDGGARDIAI